MKIGRHQFVIINVYFYMINDIFNELVTLTLDLALTTTFELKIRSINEVVHCWWLLAFVD